MSNEIFDERQTKARGVAYRVGFFTMIAYFATYCLVEELEIVWCDYYTGMLIGLMFGGAAFAITAICKDALFGVEQERWRMGLVMAILLIRCIPLAVRCIRDNTIIVDRKLTEESFSLFVCLFVAVVLVTYFLHKQFMKKRAEAEEE